MVAFHITSDVAELIIGYESTRDDAISVPIRRQHMADPQSPRGSIWSRPVYALTITAAR